MCLSGDSTLSSFLSDDPEDLEEVGEGEGDDEEQEEEEEDEDATQWDPLQGQGQGQRSAVKKAKTGSNRQLSAAIKVQVNNWLFAYRKRWGSQYFRMLPEATIYAISDSVPLTLEVGRWVGG